MKNEIAFYDALDDLCSRFLINLPARSKRNMIRLGFEIELAHWYYLDCYRSLHPEWPMYKIKEFMLLMFSRYDFLVKPKNQDIQAIYSNWIAHKRTVPTYGAILIDPSYSKVLLVQGNSGWSWGFPKGKRNEGETAEESAIREVKEETGFDIKSRLVPEHYHELELNGQINRLFYICNVPLDTKFVAECPQEITGMKWFLADRLPEKKSDSKMLIDGKMQTFFMVVPFAKNLKKFIHKCKTNKIFPALPKTPKNAQKAHRNTQLPHTSQKITKILRTFHKSDKSPQKSYKSQKLPANSPKTSQKPPMTSQGSSKKAADSSKNKNLKNPPKRSPSPNKAVVTSSLSTKKVTVLSSKDHRKLNLLMTSQGDKVKQTREEDLKMNTDDLREFELPPAWRDFNFNRNFLFGNIPTQFQLSINFA